jgi:hypothetical protein
MFERGLDLRKLEQFYITKHVPTNSTQWKLKTLSEWQNVEPLILEIRLRTYERIFEASRQSLVSAVVCTLRN